jgi:hypothetical protein
MPRARSKNVLHGLAQELMSPLLVRRRPTKLPRTKAYVALERCMTSTTTIQDNKHRQSDILPRIVTNILF